MLEPLLLSIQHINFVAVLTRLYLRRFEALQFLFLISNGIFDLLTGRYDDVVVDFFGN